MSKSSRSRDWHYDPHFTAADVGHPRRHVVRVADEVFILPLNAVMESLHPVKPISIHWPAASGCWKCGGISAHRRTVESVQRRGRENRATQGIVVILQSGGRRYALLVIN